MFCGVSFQFYVNSSESYLKITICKAVGDHLAILILLQTNTALGRVKWSTCQRLNLK